MASARGCERACVNSAPLCHNNRNDCVCTVALAVFVRARLIYIHAIIPRLFFFLPHTRAEIRQYSIHWKWHSPSPNGLCFTSCVLSDTGACDAYSQPARQSVVQTKWFGLAGRRGADNGCTVWLKCLWCQWLCQQLRLADPKWRRSERPAGACQGLNRPVLSFF